jgi:hypothetical protein
LFERIVGVARRCVVFISRALSRSFGVLLCALPALAPPRPSLGGAQDLLRKQDALRDEMKRQQDLVAQLSRDVQCIRMERDTLLSIHKALGRPAAYPPVSAHRGIGFAGYGSSLVSGGGMSFSTAGGSVATGAAGGGGSPWSASPHAVHPTLQLSDRDRRGDYGVGPSPRPHVPPTASAGVAASGARVTTLGSIGRSMFGRTMAGESRLVPVDVMPFPDLHAGVLSTAANPAAASSPASNASGFGVARSSRDGRPPSSLSAGAAAGGGVAPVSRAGSMLRRGSSTGVGELPSSSALELPSFVSPSPQLQSWEDAATVAEQAAHSGMGKEELDALLLEFVRGR